MVHIWNKFFLCENRELKISVEPSLLSTIREEDERENQYDCARWISECDTVSTSHIVTTAASDTAVERREVPRSAHFAGARLKPTTSQRAELDCCCNIRALSMACKKG